MSSAPRPGEVHRQEVIDLLCDAYARDEVELDEFERRIEVAHRAETAADLDALLAGISTQAQVPAGRRRPGSPDAAHWGSQVGSPVAAAPVRERQAVMGVMGGATRRGRWTPARKITAVGIMGGVELDFREAVFPPGVTEVQAFAFWGGIEILAPPHIRVECSGIGIMGGFDHREDASGASNDGSVVLRVTGVAVMGGVDVKVRYPGETGRDARRRLKEERLDQRRVGRGKPPRDDEY